MTRLPLLTAIALASLGCFSKASAADEPAKAAGKDRMPVYVTPYYNSVGPKINVGPYSKEMASATADSVLKLSEKMKKERETLPVEPMFVMAIRLYDLGHKDEAIYWFYSAYFRARLVRNTLKKESLGGIGSEGFERRQAHGAFHQLAGEYINGYAFGELEQLERQVRQVKSENETTPKLNTIYPKLQFIDEAEWPEKNKESVADLDKLLDFIVNNADEIKATRKENGIEGKY